MIFSVSLVLAAGVLNFVLMRPSASAPALTKSTDRLVGPQKPGNEAPGADAEPDTEGLPPWGELLTQDTQMERPEEYTARELDNVAPATWTFSSLKPEQVRDLMATCGLTRQQIDRAFQPGRHSVTDTNVVIVPDRELILSLSAEARSLLYTELARNPANHYMTFPFCFPGNSFEEIANSGQLSPEILSLVRPLLYRRGDAQYFSDFQSVLEQLPAEKDRLRTVRALSSQSAVLARLRVRPSTDIDKVLGYWASAPGVRFTDLRPLLESLQRSRDGGTVSLLYLLPPFARERLYTFPLPSQPGDPTMDCHWSTLNFFNDPPDNRFGDPAFVTGYLKTNCYQVAKATRYGDLIFLCDEGGGAIHSAVYIADDVVFTKNGNNYMEPWMLMRMKNMIAHYSIVGQPHMVVYRNRES